MVEHVEINVDHYIVVTEEGIEKTPGKFDMTNEEIIKINLIEQKIGE